ncbi:hypothetical protein [uncultured Clostridium sp.]|uniref:hypothetical protein n=1 Tax=uncultured Clostridium sp. TaxID=59620 RepID=UPI0025EE3E81|nr:hypothetical protein [uncultured Clostridium sp.]
MSEKGRKYYRVIIGVIWLVIGGLYIFKGEISIAIINLIVSVLFFVSAFSLGKKDK